MTTDIAQQKRQVHELVDRLAPAQVTAVRSLLETMMDPVARSIAAASIDDEPLSAEDAKALDEAREWMKHNRAIPHEQVLAELGFAQAEIDNFKEQA